MLEPRIEAAILFWIYAFKLLSVRELLLRPKKNGQTWFLSVEVGSDFYQGPGAAVLRGYRSTVLIANGVDWAIGLAFAAVGHLDYAILQQVIGVILFSLINNLIMFQYAYKARLIVGPAKPSNADAPATSVQLSLEPRRLRDYSYWPLELSLFVALLLAVAIPLVKGHLPSPPRAFVWFLYLHAGLVLLKLVFIHWRMKFPMARTDDYKRWRAAWLRYHLRVFDGARVVFTSVLLNLSVRELFSFDHRSVEWRLVSVALWVPATLAVLYVWLKENKRLGIAQKETRPFELIREYPPARPVEGRFLAGGFLYFNRESPLMLAHGAQRIALNLAHKGTLIWAGYLIGLVALFVWQIAT